MPNKPQHIVLASGNRGKIEEIQTLLADRDILLHPQTDFAIESIEETGLTFIENAILKARHAARQSGLAAIADDSGLVVDALNGAPGIHSSRYAGPHADDQTNLKRLLDAMRDVPDRQRSAYFYCAMVYLTHAEDPAPIIGLGRWSGWITHAPSGNNGFGYDPIFALQDRKCSSAELPAAKKNRLSHRGQALNQLISQLPA